MTQAKHRVILVNLGSPLSPKPRDVGKFLRQFLGDTRVVEAPSWLWWWVLNLIIVPFRSRRSARNYQKIWWPEGSPIRVISQRQQKGVQALVNAATVEGEIEVVIAETYGTPSVADVLDNAVKNTVESVHVIPMYPQYSATTTAPIYDQVASWSRNNRVLPKIIIENSFYSRHDYIVALANKVRDHYAEFGAPEKLVMSFHGIPEDCVAKGDPYQQQCLHTAQLLAEELQLSDDQWCCTFQSRFGPKQWLQPYTDETLEDLAQSGIKKVAVISPAFVADCLETLEELCMENRDLFLEAGGETYSVIPCLNDSADFLQVISQIISENAP